MTKENFEKEKRLFEERKNKLDQDINMYSSTDLNDIDNILNLTVEKVYNFL